MPRSAGWRRVLLLAALLPALGGCAVVAVTSAVVGAGVSVASTAVDATVAVGKGAVKVGGAVLGASD
ncbi:hypothetical protein AAKU55_004367 [Oxalobacteraceae bacterium GrIS 1.11]